MVFKVGLTGGVASGKTTVTGLFSKLGVEVVDADIIARQLLEKNTDCYRQVVEHFSTQVLLDNGEINRTWLRDRIFTDPAARKLLESILHPQVRRQMLAAAAKCKGPYCIFSIPLLVEADMQDLVDRIVVVDVSEAEQRARLIRRDSITDKQADQMLSNQFSRRQRLAITDDIIDNNGQPDALDRQVHDLHQLYLSLASNHH